MRGAGHLPRADTTRVGLLRRCVAQLDEVRLRLEHEDRDGQVGPDAEAGRECAPKVIADRQGAPPSAPAMDEDPVKGVGGRLQRVGEGRQVES